MTRDIHIIRDLAKRVAEIAGKDIQEMKRDKWRRHNEFESVPPPIYIRTVANRELIAPYIECEDPFYRSCESSLRRSILQDTIGDDYIIEPWVTVHAALKLPEQGGWGVRLGRAKTDPVSGGFTIDPPLRNLEDVDKLITPGHEVDEEETRRLAARVEEAVDGALIVDVDRSPFWTGWHGDISTDLGYLRGIEQMLWDMMDSQEWLHELLAFMRDGILKAHREAEIAGDWRLSNHENQSMPYAGSLEDPKANSRPVLRKDLWLFVASQETGAVSPEMFDEFMLSYQEPIMREFAMVSYGCCEDLSRKIGLLRRIPNLRRIAVTPFADIRVCAEQLGEDYICSWRPSPADMVAYGFDPDRVRKTVRDAREIFRANGCSFDVCLKDVETVQGDQTRLRRFVEIVREETEK